MTFLMDQLSALSPARPICLFSMGTAGQKPSTSSTVAVFAPEKVLSCDRPVSALGPHLSANADLVFHDERALFSIARDDALRCQSALQGRHVYFN